MTVKKTQLVAPKSPRLPSPRDEYNADQLDQLNSVLRTYFNQIDTTQAILLGPTGARFLDFPYAILFHSTDQTAASSTESNPVQFNSLQEGTGVSVASGSRLTVDNPGLYTFAFLLQLRNSALSSQDVYFWLRKNMVNVENTAHRITAVAGYSRPALDFTLQLEQDDFVELMWNTTNTSVELGYTAAQTLPVPIPAIPSAYVNVQFMSAVNSSGVDIYIPPAPPAPSPSPTPSPTPAPGPAPSPTPAPPPPGSDTAVQAIFTSLGAGNRSWWYPEYANDRIENSDGTGDVGDTTTDAMVGRLVDHSTNGYHLNWAINKPLWNPTYEYLNVWARPALVSLGGSVIKFTAAFAVRFDSGTYTTLCSDVVGAANVATNGMYLRFSGGTLTYSVGTGSGRVQVQQTGLIEGASAPVYIILAGWDGANIHLQVDDLATVSAACTTVSAGSSDMQVFSNPFADFSLGGWEGWDHLYGAFWGGFILKNSWLGETDRNTLRFWLGDKAGKALSGSNPPAPTPAPPAPTPAPPPSTEAPTISNLARHPKDMLRIGDYYIEDNRWQAALAGIAEGTESYQFLQQVERSLTEGANGEIAARFKWYWPRYQQNGTEYDHANREVKAFPCIIYGAKPGYDSQGTQWPAFDFAVRLPDGASVASAPPGTPDPIAADWQPLGGSVDTTAPAGSSGGVLPLQTPVQTLNAQLRYSFTTPATGVGHMSFDIWLQETSAQGSGFTSASITHEVMIPIANWGNYGSPHTVGGAWSKDPSTYSHDVTIGGTVYKVYIWQNKPTSPITGEYTPGVYWPGAQYNFGSLNGAFTNEETGQPRIGWKFIVYEPADILTGHPATDGLVRVDIAGILADIRSRSDSRGVRWARGTEYIGSIELGCEFVYGTGDLTVYDYNITANALPPAPTPTPSPAPPPASAPFYPFASRLDAYPNGIMPTNFTTSEMDDRVVSCYNRWKNQDLRKAPNFVGAGIYSGQTITDGWYTSNGGGGCFSEGQGYGMLIVVVMAGYDPNAKVYFDGMFKVARGRPAYGLGTNYLMDWKLGSDMSSEGGGWSASDGDLDIAQALLMADRQWGSSGAINYRQEAINTIYALKAFGFHSLGFQYYANQDASRTSDYMYEQFRAFKRATGDTFWDTAVSGCKDQITNIINGYSSTARLMPDFIKDPDGNPYPAPPYTVDPGDFTGNFAYNAIRNAWRWGVDYLFSGDAVVREHTDGIVRWLKADCGGNPFNIHDEYLLSGAPRRPSSTYFAEGLLAGLMVGAMNSAEHQTFLNTLFQAHTDNFSTDYYDSELQLIAILIASGNWWQPE